MSRSQAEPPDIPARQTMPDSGAARYRRLSQKSSFVALAAATMSMMAAASAPSLIYPLYRERWHFSVTVLTTRDGPAGRGCGACLARFSERCVCTRNHAAK
jgi:hypothetical protein